MDAMMALSIIVVALIGLYGDTSFISPHYVHGTRKSSNTVAS